MERYILNLSCQDKIGIVAAVTGFLAQHNGFIIESAQCGDETTGNFFMRVVFESDASIFHKTAFTAAFAAIKERFNLDYQLYNKKQRTRILVLVSKASHCLNDLLHRFVHGNSESAEIVGVVSNHTDLKKMTKWYDLPFYHLPITPENKSDQEAKIYDLFQELNCDLMVLARYMQILSPDLVQKVYGRAINIHHSFLPSFKGAKPYHQAFDRGVKIIGATAHYVSNDLDEGPIIEQEVIRVDHVHNPNKFVELGRDIESLVLAHAVRYHIERRIILNKHKTVVFR